MKKTKRSKEKELSIWHVVLSVLPLLALRVVYEKIILLVSTADYFCIPSFRRTDALIFILLIVFFLINTYGRKKLSNTIFKAAIILLVLVIVYMSLFCGYIVIDNDEISYSLMPGIETYRYDYNDIESAELYTGMSGWRSYSLSFVYELRMTNGDKIVLNISQAYYKNKDAIMEFDKRISQKRSVRQGEYGLSDMDENMSVESFNYLNGLFDNN